MRDFSHPLSPEMSDPFLLKMNLSEDEKAFWDNNTLSRPPLAASYSTADVYRRSYAHLFFAAIAMVTLTLTAIIANLLVIVIFFRHRRLRRCKNVYLVGLSLADLGVGLCMPMALADEMLLDWAPGGWLCRVYLVLRDSLLFISLLTVLQVSTDRWWSIHRPFNYRVRQSKSVAAVILILTWITIFILHVPIAGLYDVITILLTSSDQSSVGTFGELLEDIGGSSKASLGVEGEKMPTPRKMCASKDSRLDAAVTCEVPYRNDLIFVLVFALIRFLAPCLYLLVLNITLYAKIRERKRLQVRRSISGIDTVLFSLLKASSSDSECYREESDLLRSQRAERRLSRLSPAPLNRRHTMSQILFPGYYPVNPFSSSPRQCRPLRRRVSLQDCLQSSGYSSSLQVPRRKSQGLTQSLSDSLLPVSRRHSRDDLAKDLLVKQDKKAACFLGLLQGVLLLCWSPLTVVSIINAANHPWLLPRWTQAASLWLLLANSAINPFLYGLFNAEFSKVVMHWFKIKGSKRDRLKTALRRFSMHIAVELEKNGFAQTPTFETVVE